ncbi:phage tail tube protein [Marinicauda sp. Alg238-R41]|uniref:phage tail tube protein n=1 Tax=Marinicauda sp. Alg238-R41 TaxID=2993447 RepID=UPI0022E0B8D3|nr:phage tail tube protein [Marinicauda sp. Alg238-R41]
MPDVASQRSRGLVLAAGLQTDFVSPLSSGLGRYTYYEESLNTTEAPAEDNELGLETHDDRSPTDPGPGSKGGQGSIVVPADLNQLGFWLTLLLGTPDTTDNEDGSWTHVFESGADTLPSATLQRALGSGRWKIAKGLMVNSIAFGLAKSEDGYRTFRLDCMAREVYTAGAPIEADPAAMAARAKLPAKRGLTRLNSVVNAQLVSGEFTFANNLQREDYADSADDAGDLASAMEPGDLSFSGNPTYRFKRGAALNGAIDLFTSHTTPFAHEIEYARSDTSSLLIATPRCFAPPAVPAANGPGPVDFSTSITARQVVGETPAPLMTVTLTNAVESYS